MSKPALFVQLVFRVVALLACASLATLRASDCGCESKVRVIFKQQGRFAGTVSTKIDGGGVNRKLTMSAGTVRYDNVTGTYYANQGDMACGEWSEEVDVQLTLGEPVTWTTRWVGDASNSGYTQLDGSVPLPLIMYTSLPDAPCLRFLVDLSGNGDYVPVEEGTPMYAPPSGAEEFTWHLKVEMSTPPVAGVFQCSLLGAGIEKDDPKLNHYQNPVPLGSLCEQSAALMTSAPAAAPQNDLTIDATTSAGKSNAKQNKAGFHVPVRIKRKNGASIDHPSSNASLVKARFEARKSKGVSGALTSAVTPDVAEADKLLNDSKQNSSDGPGLKSASASQSVTASAETLAAAVAPAGITPGAYLARSIGALHQRLTLGTGLGSLIYEAPVIDSGAYLPARLRFDEVVRPDVIYRDEQGAIKQALFPSGLLDVHAIDPLHLDVRFYAFGQFEGASGSFTITDDNPIARWLIESPDATAAGRIRFTGTRNGTTDVHLATWRPASGGDAGKMTLSMYSDATVEETTYVLSLSTTPTRTERVTKRRGASGPVEEDRSEVFGEFYYWGAAGEVFEAVIERTLDPDGASLSTLYGYYDQPSQPGGQLNMVIYPDGYWEAYDRYADSGDLSATYRPWIDSPADPFASTAANCVVTHVAYQYPDTTTEVKISDTIWSNSVRFGYNIFSRSVGGPDYVETTQTNLSSSLSTMSQTVSNGRHGSTLGTYDASGTMHSFNNAWGFWDPATQTFYFTTAPGRIVAQRVINGEGTMAQPGGIPNRTNMVLRYADANGRSLLEETYVNNGTTFIPGTRTDWISQHIWTYDFRGLLVGEKINGRVIYEASYDSDGRLQWSKDELGTRTDYTYDVFGRIFQSKRVAGGATPDQTTTFTYDAAGHVVTEVVAAGTGANAITQTTQFRYDLAGRLIQTIGPDGLQTSTVESILVDGGGLPARRQITTTNPDGSQEIAEYYRDRRLFRRYGSAVPAEYWGYGLTSLGYSISAGYHDIAGTQLRVQRIEDWAGNTIGEILPGFTGQPTFTRVSTYGGTGPSGTIRGLLVKQTEPGVAPRLYEYDDLGVRTAQGLDLDGNGILDRSGLDLVSLTKIGFTKDTITQQWWAFQQQSRLEADNSADPTLVAENREQLTGLPSGTIANTETLAPGGARSRTSVTLDRSIATRITTVRNLAADAASQPNTVTEIGGLLRTTRGADASADVSYTYDALGRQKTVVHPFTGTTTYAYDAQGQLESITDTLQQQTRMTYYPQGQVGAGRIATTRDAAGKTTYFTYDVRGRLWRQWGLNAYPQQFAYNDDNQITSLRTFRTTDAPASGGIDWSAATWPSNAPAGDLTLWIYHFSGLLDRKRYADNSEIVYTYDSARRLRTKTNARAQTVTYGYNTLGALGTMTYSAGSLTPDCSYSYDRAGRARTISDASGSRTLGYDQATGMPGSETYTSGLLSGQSVGRTYDAFGRPEQTTVPGVYSAMWSFDTLSRPQKITGTSGTVAGLEATYVREAGGSRIQDLEWRAAASLKARSHRTYDGVGRLTSVTTYDGNAAVLDLNGYSQFDANNRHTRVDREDGSHWDYRYNDRGEVTSADRRDSTDQTVPGHQVGYSYDTIGNRLSSSRGAQSSTYQPNSLNQYSQRTVPSAITVVGTAASDAKVTADFQPTIRQGEYFNGDVPVSNTSAAVWNQFEIFAVKNNAGPNGEDDVAKTTRTAFVARTPEVFIYDADGNLTSDGRWSYTWDAENRLVSLETNTAANAAGTPRQKVSFSYDVQGRRVSKQASTWDSANGLWNPGPEQRFLYDGWNLVAEFDATLTLKRSHLWGLDISGSPQGAGGVGGLLATVDANGSHIPWYDGNGNVTGYSSASTGQSEAHFTYGPFGESLAATGTLANTFVYRFSAKFADSETSLIYYGFRYYNSSVGRWLSRDTIEEQGGVNLYVMVCNSPINRIDPLGLNEVDVHLYLTAFLARMAGFSDNDAMRIGQSTQRLDDPGDPRDAMYGGVSWKNMRTYHFVNQGRLNILRAAAWKDVVGGQATGEYFHALEDTYPHSKGVGDRNWRYRGGKNGGLWGHLLAGHSADWTWRDAQKSMKEAEETYHQMLVYAKVHGVDICNAKKWSEIQNQVRQFMEYEPATGGILVESVTFEGYSRKIKILDPSYALAELYREKFPSEFEKNWEPYSYSPYISYNTNPSVGPLLGIRGDR